jgi:glycosyltransferase involved in cell wall biosynthesis
LPEYRHLLVHLRPENDFILDPPQAQLICLHHKGKWSYGQSIRKLKRIIKAEKVQLVHSHLLLSTVLARQACGHRTPLISSYHSLLHEPSSPQYRPWLLGLDRLTYRKRFYTLFVSRTVQQSLAPRLGISQNQEVLPNYIADAFFEQQAQPDWSHRPLRIAVVGSFRPEKNHKLLLELLKNWREAPLHIDCWGKGPLRNALETEKEAYGLSKLHFPGDHPHLSQKLAAYDLLLAPSQHEGFGLAPAEAMAMGLPVLAADIPAFREVCGQAALFFDPKSWESLAEQLKGILGSQASPLPLIQGGKQQAKQFRRAPYLRRLREVYEDLMRG